MLLQVKDLRTYFDTPDGWVRAVDGVSLEVPPGGVLALVGESGCGKSLTALSILRLVPPGGRVVSGAVRFHGRDLLHLPTRELRAIRGDRIAMIFQEPMNSLNPLLTAGEQVSEVLRIHRRMSARVARTRAVELLGRVGIPDPEQRRRAYPHELSGGMRQRVMIAMALACTPELLIADEPTTALDVTIQAQILDLLSELRRETGMAMIFITHDMGIVARLADTVCVMYAGRIVEHGPVSQVFGSARHPYTRGLLECTPRLGWAASGRLPVIPGEVPDPRRRPSGCAFNPRCPWAGGERDCELCDPPLRVVAPGHSCACWKAGTAARQNC